MHLPQATRPPQQLRGPPRRDAHDDASCEPSASGRRGLARTHDHRDHEGRDDQRTDAQEADAEERRRARDDVTRVGSRRGRLHGRLCDRLLHDGRLDLGGRGRLACRRRGSSVVTAIPRVGARDGDVVGVADGAVRDEHPEHVGTARRPRERTGLGAGLVERDRRGDVLLTVADDHSLRERDAVRAQGDRVVHARTVRGRRERGADRRADDRRGRVAGPVEGELVDEQGLGRGVEPVRDRERRRERVDGDGDRARERRDDADGVVLDVQAGAVDAEAALHLRVDSHGGNRDGEGGDVVGTGARVGDLTDGRPRVGRRSVGRRDGDDGQGHGGSSRQGRHEAVALAHVVSKW